MDFLPSRLQYRAALPLQLIATLVALGWVPGNLLKLAAMLLVWWLGFRRLSRADLLLMAAVNVIFIVADLSALQNGVFHFLSPDLLGLPLYEFFIWGFYVLHTLRLIGGDPPRLRLAGMLSLVAAFVLTMSLISSPPLLLLALAGTLVVGVVLFHEPLDLVHIGYLTALGAAVEYVGTATGQWAYPGAPPGGVPVWSFVMWAGIGLFVRRLVAPLFEKLREATGEFDRCER